MLPWSKEKTNDVFLKVLLFLISPFFAAIYAVKRMNTKSSYAVFMLFSLFFGMAYTISNNSNLDGTYYRNWFEWYDKANLQDYIYRFQDFLTFELGIKDFYFDSLAFFLTRFTSNYHWLFAISAIIFSYFALKTFRFFTSERSLDFSIVGILLTYLFMSIDIFSINGLRFWTAAWIGVYSIFQIFVNNNKRFFFLALFTVFIHASFLFFIAVIVLIYLLKNLEKTWVILFFISFFIGSVASELFQNVADYFPSVFRKLILSYTDSEYMRQIKNEGSGFIWVARIMNFLMSLYVNIMVYLLIQNKDMIKGNVKTKELYLFLIPFMSIINFVMPIPSLGVRYFQLSLPIIAYIWLINFKDKKYKLFIYLMPVFFWFVMYRQITRYLTVLDYTFFISNPFVLIYNYLIEV